MKQVSNELAIGLLAKAYEANYNSNPDIGFGYQLSHFISLAARDLGLTPNDYDSIKALQLAK